MMVHKTTNLQIGATALQLLTPTDRLCERDNAAALWNSTEPAKNHSADDYKLLIELKKCEMTQAVAIQKLVATDNASAIGLKIAAWAHKCPGKGQIQTCQRMLNWGRAFKPMP